LKHRKKRHEQEKIVEKYACQWPKAKPCGQCFPCALHEFCENNWAPMVTPELLGNQDWLRDFKIHTATRALHGSLWIPELFSIDSERRVAAHVLEEDGSKGEKIEFDLAAQLLPSDELIFSGNFKRFTNSLQRWLERFLNTPVADDAIVFVTPQRKDLACIVATLICIDDPEAAATFGVRPRPKGCRPIA